MSRFYREAARRQLSGEAVTITEWASVALNLHRTMTESGSATAPVLRAAAGLARVHFRQGGWWNDTELVRAAASVADSTADQLRSGFQMVSRGVRPSSPEESTLLRALDHRLTGPKGQWS